MRLSFKPKSRRLKAARILAGYRSARTAALAHSWPQSLYAAHESGSRSPSDSRLQEYLSAFGVDPSQIEKFIRPEDDPELQFELQYRRETEMQIVGRRLRLARRLAGFATAGDAAAAYDWKPQTYYAHESGRYGVSDQMAAVYSLAFGVSADWLLQGRRPSGLSVSSEVDEIADAYVSDGADRLPEGLQSLISVARRGERSAVYSTRTAARTVRPLLKATSTSGDVLDVVPEGLEGSKGGAWGFPESFLKMVWNVRSTNLKVVAISPSAKSPGERFADRALIDCNIISGGSSTSFVARLASGEIALVQGTAGTEVALILGRVIALITRPHET